jgi:hypothetical protein
MRRHRPPPRSPHNLSPLSLYPDPEPEPGPLRTAQRKRKFYLALACYAVIAVLAGMTLDGNFRLVVWILLGGLALKTYIGLLKDP